MSVKFGKKKPWWNGETIFNKGNVQPDFHYCKSFPPKMQFWVRDESRIFVRLHFYSTQKAAGTVIVKKTTTWNAQRGKSIFN